MALVVNTNVNALNIQRNLSNVNSKVSTAMQRLSTGLRINSAKDDASGFVQANDFKAKYSAMQVAYQNSSEAQSMLQTADGAYSQINDMLVRMKDLATQAASGQSNQDSMKTEFNDLQKEITRIANSTMYNTTSLLNNGSVGGSGSNTIGSQGITFQIGQTNASKYQLNITLNAATAGALGVSSADNNISIATQASAQAAMNALDTALGSVNQYMANVGAYQNRLQYTMSNLQVSIQNYQASESTIRDANMAQEVTTLTKDQILQQSGMAMLAQANSQPQQILTLLR